MKEKIVKYYALACGCCIVIGLAVFVSAVSGSPTAELAKIVGVAGLAVVMWCVYKIAAVTKYGSQDKNRSADMLGYIDKGDYNIYLEKSKDPYVELVGKTVNKLTEKVTGLTKSLTSEKRKTEYILDNMDSGLLLVDSKLNVRQCNSPVYKYLAHVDEFVGKNLTDIPELQSFVTAVNHALQKEVSSMFDLDLMDSTGVIVSVRVNPIAGEWVGEENDISALIIITNVTQSRQMELLRSEFVANVSHELKTPITSINGFAELIQSGVVTDPKTVAEYVGRIHEEAQRMTYLIDDILRLSSLENKQAEEIYEPVDLKSLSEDIFVSLSLLMAKRGITSEVIGSAVFSAYPGDMHQLLKNLIENAVKYNRDGGKVTVRLVPDANTCTIGVSDTGIGIPIEHQSRIFERFYRVDKGRSKRVGGTGLGLSIVKHIAAKYHGQISLVSRPDEGTSIRIMLPIEAD